MSDLKGPLFSDTLT